MAQLVVRFVRDEEVESSSLSTPTNQAKKARRIIAGLMEGHQKKVDFSKYNRPTLVRSIEELGKARE